MGEMSLEMVIPSQREYSGDHLRRRRLWPCGRPSCRSLSAFRTPALTAERSPLSGGGVWSADGHSIVV